MSKLHHLLPETLIGGNIAAWIRSNSIDNFKDVIKTYLDPEEIADLEHESAIRGREINSLTGLLKQVTNAIKKGITEPLAIEIPATKGTAALDVLRNQNYELLERGYEAEEVTIWGLVDPDSETMEYFTENGGHVADRSRPLTPKEKREHLSPAENRLRVSNEFN